MVTNNFQLNRSWIRLFMIDFYAELVSRMVSVNSVLVICIGAIHSDASREHQRNCMRESG